MRIRGLTCAAGAPNPDPISDQKNVIFHTRFLIWPLKSILILRPGL